MNSVPAHFCTKFDRPEYGISKNDEQAKSVDLIMLSFVRAR